MVDLFVPQVGWPIFPLPCPFLPLNWPPKKAKKNKNYKGESVRRRRRECEKIVKV